MVNCAWLLPAVAFWTQQPAPERSLGVAFEVERLAREESVWPGFEPLSIPLAIYDGERTYLFRHPSPPEEFNEISGGHSLPGRHPQVTSNSSAEIGGVLTATLLIEGVPADRSLRQLAATALHEAFHVFQRRRHPSWQGNEGDLFLYPVERDDLLLLRRHETEAMRRALAVSEGPESACWARRVVAARAARFALMDSPFSEYERRSELNEGLAAYVQHRFAGLPSVEIPPDGFAADAVRDRVYVSGEALARLLDRLAPGWKAELEAQDNQYLDVLLGRALSAGEACSFTQAELGKFERWAKAAAEEVGHRRARLLTDFEKREGSRIVVEAGTEHLWPQGFDPLNAVVVPGGVLHTRYLRLGNQSGSLELFNGWALSESAGEHPLFNGVRRVTLAGLGEVQVKDQAGVIEISSAQARLTFEGGRVEQSGDVVTLRLP